MFHYMLAPLENMTDNAFRTICFRYGADMTFTEMNSIDALSAGNENTWDRIKPADDTPTVIQLIGTNEDKLRIFLGKFRPEKGFSGFNLNLGCPNPQVIRLGQGSAMVKRVSKVKRMISLMKSFGFNSSVKLRLGLNEYEKEKKTYLNLIRDVDADYFIVHPRHGKDTYNDRADFSVYDECVKTGKRIIANGDIKTREQVEELRKLGLKGVMIGREAIKDPLIFARLKGLALPNIEKVKDEYLELSKKYDAPERYYKNVIRRIGKDTVMYMNG